MSRKATKLQDQLAYPPRAMRAETAAAYLSISRTVFLELVDEGKMPKPVRVRAMALWDRLELDAAFDDLRSTPINAADAKLEELRQRRLARERGGDRP